MKRPFKSPDESCMLFQPKVELSSISHCANVETRQIERWVYETQWAAVNADEVGSFNAEPPVSAHFGETLLTLRRTQSTSLIN